MYVCRCYVNPTAFFYGCSLKGGPEISTWRSFDDQFIGSKKTIAGAIGASSASTTYPVFKRGKAGEGKGREGKGFLECL